MESRPESLPPEERAARLRLHLTPGLGPSRFQALLREFGSAREALRAPAPALREVVGAAVALALCDELAHRKRQDRAARVCDRLRARVTLYGEAHYPPPLRGLSPPPAAVWSRGTLPAALGIGIVGTRRASARGRAHARRLAAEAVARGRVVISGGAYGIDAEAHVAALDAGGRTVVVFAGGLDQPYPERHGPLFERAARQGALLSAYPPGTPPVRGGFLARNALVAALAEALVVVEAGWRSGAHSTARHARSLGVPVLAVPGSPGTDRLLSQGAIPVSPQQGLPTADRSEGERDAGLMDAEEQRVLEAVRALDGAYAEQVARQLGEAPGAVVSLLQGLRAEGRIVLDPAGRFRYVPPVAP